MRMDSLEFVVEVAVAVAVAAEVEVVEAAAAHMGSRKGMFHTSVLYLLPHDQAAN